MHGQLLKNFNSTPVLEDVRVLDGAGVGASWLDAMIARGLGWIVNIGGFSTPIVGGGDGTVLDLDQPEGIIDVPAGVTIRPFRVNLHGQVPLLATDADEAECLIAVDRTQRWDGTGTKTDETPLNLRTDVTSICPCRAASAFTADTTDPVLGIELARKVIVGDIQTAVGTTWTLLDLLYEPKSPPFIVGPAMLVVYWGGTVAVPGFAEIGFVAFPTSRISSLGVG